MKTMKPVGKLYCNTVSTEPRHFDFFEGFGETWEIVCPKGFREGKGEDDLDSISPMMNYWYPLPDDFDQDIKPADGATILQKYVCLTLVQNLKTDEYGLALTGGGMDLSWDICEAYMRLGYLPPVHFCNLPNFAGMKFNNKTRWVIAGCSRSLKLAKREANWQLSKLKHLRQELKARG